MRPNPRLGRRSRIGIALAAALALALSASLAAFANVALTQVSTDPYTNTTSQHATEVEPDTFSAGSTIVSTFQAGRFVGGGASNIGFATSTDNGATWTHAFLPGITKFGTPAGAYDRVSDPSVAFDARHNVWLISSLAIKELSGGGINGAAVVVNRSTDGGLTWSNAITVAAATAGMDLDKNWTVCDSTATSPFYGNCYTEYDDFGHGNQVHMATSTDGGLTWTEASVPNLAVIGGQPLVQPNGTVIVPIDNAIETAVLALKSTDGGANYSSAATIDQITSHRVAGRLRTSPLPSAEIDGAGKVYVVWQDCRFERGCRANDIVMSTSSDGSNWSKVVRIPIDAVGSGVDHFIPGLAVDRSTSGSSAHLGLTYYYYPDASCNVKACQLSVGFVSSSDGGTTWSSAPTQLAGPMTLSWLPDTSQGRMVGDYISTSFSGGTAHPIIAVANAPTSGGADCATATPNCDQAMYAPSTGLSAGAAVARPVGREEPVPNAASDHPEPVAPVTHR
jgi:hypothetical protein